MARVVPIGYAARVSSSRVVPTLSFLAGLAGLAWILHRFGGPAFALLDRRWDPVALALFVLAVAAAIVLAAARWRILLDGLGVSPGLARLCAFRAASQSVAAVLPGGRIGGEPLRVWWATETGVPVSAAITSVAVDRTLEMATSVAFAVAFALVLMQLGIPGLDHTIAGVLVGATGLAVAIGVSVRRLRGSGLVAPLVRSLGANWSGAERHAHVLEAAEADARRLLARPGRLGAALAIGIAADLLTLIQYHWLLGAFGLPDTPVAIVAAIFAAGAARTLPVPGAVGTVEAAELWLFGILGYPTAVGLAVGLVTRVRDLAWAAPGFLVFLARALVRPRAADPASSTIRP